MKKYIKLLFSLLIVSSYSMADCKYLGNPGGINMRLSPRILSDTSLPVGSVLYAETAGISSMKTFYDCDITSADPDRYRVVFDRQVQAPGVTGIHGEPVYETGIDGIGFQVSDAISGVPGRPVVAKIGTYPLTVTATTGVKQYTVWLIKTKPVIDTSKNSSPLINITYAAGRATQVNALTTNTILLRIGFSVANIRYRATSCNLNLRGGNPIKLDTITAPELRKVTQGKATSKAKDVILDMSCPETARGLRYAYWFNPISGSSASADGVLPNSLSVAAGGAKDVGFIIKQGTTPVKFYDYDSYMIRNTQASQQIKLNVDYYRFSKDISQGNVSGLLEVILQEQ